jgi:hypothetical protein
MCSVRAIRLLPDANIRMPIKQQQLDYRASDIGFPEWLLHVGKCSQTSYFLPMYETG